MNTTEQAEIIEEYINEAIASGERGTYTLNTARGITYHIMHDIGLI